MVTFIVNTGIPVNYGYIERNNYFKTKKVSFMKYKHFLLPAPFSVLLLPSLQTMNIPGYMREIVFCQ